MESNGSPASEVGPEESEQAGRVAEASRRLSPLPDEKSAFQEELTRRLWLLRREIRGLDERATRVSRSAARDFKELLVPLRWRADALERRLERFFRDSSEPWELFRKEAEEIWRELKGSLVAVAAAFRRRYPGADTGTVRRRPRR